ncbi:heat shock transcription factor 4 [Moniliophthora roreri MCA 2997]|nr:heat shock transcription factor 4 [Moniliophthora roreri MCA 2997]KAI3612379.1 heat shock transcription factor 4 [Moniliophthora roreri]
MDLYPPSNSFPSSSPDSKSFEQKSPNESTSKPQATFLTKLYALLERPENSHMIRWDPQGEHIIVERPEQLALHVLPSIYRQSRFASFSRQLNIYGFMRKVNLRNVDPAIDDPDASTWSHPTLNRHSPPEVVANFKRRVPPRLPKPRKRDIPDTQQLIPPPRPPPSPTPIVGRARGFSAPGSFAPAWATSTRQGTSGIPPLTVPSDPPSHHYDDSPTSPYAYPSTDSWSYTSSASSSSLSSLLNPSSHSRPTPTINTSVSSQSSAYASPFSSMPLSHAHSPLSPDHSRPGTGYGYDDYGSRPGSSHRHSPRSENRASPYSVPQRRRRLSQAMSPYPNPVPHHDHYDRPSTSPQPMPHNGSDGLPRVRSMIQLPSVPDHHNNHSSYPQSYQTEFAYSPVGIPSVPSSSSISSLSSTSYSYGARPSTSTSTSSQSQANTPPLDTVSVGVNGHGHGGYLEARGYEPDFGFVQMDGHHHAYQPKSEL